MGDRKVGLKTHLALCSKRVCDLSGCFPSSWWEGLVTLEQHLKEDLRVESEGSGIEGNGITVGDERVRASDGVRDQERDNLEGTESAGILKAVQDSGNIIGG